MSIGKDLDGYVMQFACVCIMLLLQVRHLPG
jgi:hypothetical protein